MKKFEPRPYQREVFEKAKDAKFPLAPFHRRGRLSYVSEYGVIGGEMTTVIHNICVWYDGTMRPAKGHNDGCKWKFDGQIWRHL